MNSLRRRASVRDALIQLCQVHASPTSPHYHALPRPTLAPTNTPTTTHTWRLHSWQALAMRAIYGVHPSQAAGGLGALVGQNGRSKANVMMTRGVGAGRYCKGRQAG